MKKKIALLLSLIIFIMSFSGCGQKKIKGKKNDNIINGNIDFSINIFKALNNEDGDKNIFISPLSISTALAMTLNGAENNTLKEMQDALMLAGLSKDEINKGFQYLLERLQNLDKKVEVNISNSIWTRKGFGVREDFLSRNQKYFDALTKPIDFTAPDAADKINKWISDATKKMIEEMINPPIDPNTVMMLINAIYFNGKWTDPFDPEKTKDKEFTTLDGQKKTVKMMSKEDRIEYMQNKKLKAVKLPYGDKKMSMYCILPDKNTNINTFIKKFSTDTWNEIKDGLSPTSDLKLEIPKFKMEYGIKELNNVLKSLGMRDAFSDKADFSGMADNIFISKVLHKAVIDVDEEGTKAAAATVVIMLESSMPMDPLEFIADRPFMFLIADEEDGTILFMGKMAE
jgi:serine protease inhibitor